MEKDEKDIDRIYTLYLNSLKMLYSYNSEVIETVIKRINPLSADKILNVIRTNIFNKDDIELITKLITQFPSEDYIITSDKDLSNIKMFFENTKPSFIDNDYSIVF
jgi:hypothetical protein